MKTIIFIATFYGGAFHGKLTASGEKFDKNKFTCASNLYEMGTMLEVTNINNSRSIVVKVNDRGGMGDNVIDLSEAAFKRIADLKKGKISVKVKVLK